MEEEEGRESENEEKIKGFLKKIKCIYIYIITFTYLENCGQNRIFALLINHYH